MLPGGAWGCAGLTLTPGSVLLHRPRCCRRAVGPGDHRASLQSVLQGLGVSAFSARPWPGARKRETVNLRAHRCTEEGNRKPHHPPSITEEENRSPQPSNRESQRRGWRRGAGPSQGPCAAHEPDAEIGRARTVCDGGCQALASCSRHTGVGSRFAACVMQHTNLADGQGSVALGSGRPMEARGLSVPMALCSS